ncbi:MAG: SH3 domain-containing protein [Lachnospiraceae bacterium]|nr:SH3 domain-containing protein [Lachnospiraceae bacterium]
MKKFKFVQKFFLWTVVVCMLLSGECAFVYAAGTEQSEDTQENGITELSQLMVANQKTDMKEIPDKSSATLMTYEKGDSVFVIGETADGWYQVTYQDKEGFVEKTALLKQELDVAGIDAEMAVEAEETKFVLEEVERYRQEARRSKIWGTIIVILVIGIFAMGIASTIRARKNEDTDEPENKKTERNAVETSLNIEDLDKDIE